MGFSLTAGIAGSENETKVLETPLRALRVITDLCGDHDVRFGPILLQKSVAGFFGQ